MTSLLPAVTIMTSAMVHVEPLTTKPHSEDVTILSKVACIQNVQQWLKNNLGTNATISTKVVEK